MKVLIGALLVLAAAYLFIVSRQPPQHDARSSIPEWAKSIQARFGPQFEFRDIGPGCFRPSDHVFTIAASCVTKISRSDEGYRLLHLRHVTGAPAEVTFKPATDESGLPECKRTLVAASDAEAFTIPESGGTLQITCASVCAVKAE